MIKKTILRKLNFLLLALFSCLVVYGQDSPGCGCDYYGVESCLIDSVYNASETFNVCYEVSGLSNSTLGVDQGICGVNIYFKHYLIYESKIYLTSPSGQTIQLAGYDSEVSLSSTALATWNVTFLPDSSFANPDPNLNAQWNGAQPYLTWGSYTGSYYPFDPNLNLEDLTGSANGQWCLTFDNEHLPWVDPVTGGPADAGVFYDFEVIFCDVGGLPCCMADGGELVYNGTDTSGCYGDTNLLLDIQASNENGFPQSDYYAYDYIITDADLNVIALQNEPSLVDYPPGDYSICGLSYLIDDESLIEALINDSITITAFSDSILLPDPPFCASLSSNCIDFSITEPVVKFDTTFVLCEGDTLDFLGELFLSDTIHEFVFENSQGCDSIGFLNLVFDSIDITLLEESICFGDSATINEIDFYNTTGVYRDTFPQLDGCDSIVELNLLVFPENEVILFDTICLGDSFVVADSIFDSSGTYTVVLPSEETACDSTIILNLVVEEITVSVSGPNIIDCSNSTITLDGSSSSGADNLIFEWTSSGGGMIDSPANQAAINVSTPGVYTLMVTSPAGCFAERSYEIFEDVNTPDISVDDPDIITCVTQTVEIDGSQSSFVNSGVFTWSTLDGNILTAVTAESITVNQAGTYQLILTDTVNNCSIMDSFVVQLDTITPPLSGLESEITCESPNIPLVIDGNYVGPYNWVWKDPNGDDIPNSNNVPEFFSVDVPGTYILEVINVFNGCETIDTFNIGVDTISPEIILGTPAVLDCSNLSVLIDGSASETLMNSEINWIEPVGGIQSGESTLSPVVVEPGFYTLTYTNTDNGCESSETVQVFSNVDYETLYPGADNLTLDCEITNIVLGASGDNPAGSEYIYSWEDIGGTPIGSGQTFDANVAGIYVMEVLNTSNSCISSATVEVESIQRTITANANVSNGLTCDVTEADLTGTYTDVLSSDLINVIYEWYDSNGQLVGDNSDITVDQGGIYEFIVIDTFSKCEGSVEIEVEKNTDLPSPDAGPDVSLDCETGLATLEGSFTDDPNFHISGWSTTDGNILSSDDTYLETSTVGEYAYTVTNTINGCSFEDYALVFVDTALCTPSLDTIPDVIVNCYNTPEVFGYIDASPFFDTSSNYTFSWEIVDGYINDPEDSIVIHALIGEYDFVVTNPLFGLTYRDRVKVIDGRSNPNVVVDNDTLTVNCADLEANVQLSGMETTGISTMIYQWESLSETNIVSGANSTNCFINSPGLYSFVGIDIETGCEDAATVSVGLDGVFPPNTCLPDNAQFDCDSPYIEITLDTCVNTTDYSYEWSIVTGQILSPSNDTSVQVSIENSPSYLELTITDNYNFCSSTDSILIFAEGQCFPTCEIEIPEVITCSSPSIDLDGSNSSTGADFQYSWVTDIGNITSGTNQISATVNATGFYTLFVEDITTGLSCSATVQVLEDYSTLDAIINPIDSVNCYADSVFISFSVLDNEPYSVSWLTPGNGCEVVEPFDGFYFAKCGGDYSLIVTSDSTGCESVFDFSVPVDTVRPSSILYSDTTLDCLNPGLTLVSDSSSSGDNFYFSFYNENWTLFEEGVDLPFATTTNAGIHALVVQDLINGCKDTSYYEVIDNANIFQANAGTYSPLNCENPNVLLQGSSDAFDNLEYYWESTTGCFEGDPNAQDVLISCPGEYVLVVVDTITGCDDEAYVTITQDSDLPLADAGPDALFECTVDFIVLDGSGSDFGPNISYNWSTIGGNIVSDTTDTQITVDEVGVYYLVVSNNLTDCSDTSFVEVLNGETFPIADAGPDLVIGCEQDNVQADGSNSTLGINYLWTTTNGQIELGANSLFPIFSSEGDYYLNVEDNGCTDNDTLIVVVDKLKPEVSISSFSNYINCVYDTITLQGQGQSVSFPMGEVDYRWFSDSEILGDNIEAQIDVSQPGIYYLEVQDLTNNCLDTVAIEIFESYAEPNLLYELPPVINCIDTTVIINASASNSQNGILASLTGPASANIVNGFTLTPSVDTAGVYELIIKDGFSLCADTVSISVYEDFEAPELVLSSDPNVLCEVNDAVLDLSNSTPLDAIVYQWYDEGGQLGQDGSIIEVGNVGLYYVIGQSEINGCRDTLSIDVGAKGDPIENVLFSKKELDCFGDSDAEVTINSVEGGNSPYLYRLGGLDFGSYTQFKYLPSGSYLLEVEDIDGCRYEELIVIEEPEQMQVDLGDDQYIRYGELASIFAEVSSGHSVEKVEWGNVNPDNCPDCLEIEVGPSSTSLYNILVVDDNLCEARDTVIVYVDETPAIYVPNTFSPGGHYENSIFGPFADESVARINEFKVFDRWGDLVFQNKDFEPGLENGWDGSFRGKKLQAGVYVWILEARLENGEIIYLKGSVTLLR